MRVVKKRGQISTEYLIIVGFITFLVVGVLAVALLYSSSLRDRIRFSHVTNYADTIISSAESVYYAGEPSRLVVKPYLPAGVRSISINGTSILFTVTSSSGVNTMLYTSSVPLEGTLASSEGVKRITLVAQTDRVLVSE